ncbi:MAG TPA: hypothetical protein ENH26_02075 [Candidatus Wolfebacteria bacterium]|nr:hypothetical protein [Candidatus Wolfebacteria bacterium]
MKLKTKNPRLRRGFGLRPTKSPSADEVGGQEKLKANKGIIALPTMLLIGGVIVEIGIAGLLVSYFLIQSNLGIRLSAEALAVARSGTQDAIIKIIRDKNFTSGSPYSLTVGEWSAQIIVCKDSRTISTACDDLDPSNKGKHEITSLGIVQKKQRKIQTILNVNSATGEVNVESIEEIAI